MDVSGARPPHRLGLPPRRLEIWQSAKLVLFVWHYGGDFRVRVTVPGD